MRGKSKAMAPELKLCATRLVTGFAGLQPLGIRATVKVEAIYGR